MNLLLNIPINTLSVIMLSVILFYIKKFGETESIKNKYYTAIVASTIMMLIIDILGRADGNPGTIMPVLNHAGNFLLFLFSPLIASLWIAYIHHYIYNNEKLSVRLKAFIISVNALNAVIVILTQWFGWYYNIDENNIYHRGPFHSVSIILPFLLLLIALAVIYRNRYRIVSKHYYSLIAFIIPTFICSALQIFIYGVSLIYNGMAISVFILFLYVQIQDIFTDYLTGVANRKKLELQLKKKIISCGSGSTFSAIMLDIDNFKKVNDTYGHKTGDMILQNTAAMMRNCLGNEGLIARYGGDEFCIILDTADPEELSGIVDQLKCCVKSFNETNKFPFRLGISMGYAIYQPGMSLDDFQNKIDKLMYDHKHYEAY